MLYIHMPSVSILGWTILALSLATDHLDVLGWLTKSFTITESQT